MGEEVAWACVLAGGVPHGIEQHTRCCGTGRVLLVGKLITCWINLLGPSTKTQKVQIWREGLSGQKQDGPKKYLGAGQQLLEHFFPKG